MTRQLARGLVAALAWLLASPHALAQGGDEGCGGAFYPVADASVSRLQPDEPLGRAPDLRVVRGKKEEWRALLAFDLAGRIPPGAAIHNARLELAVAEGFPLPYGLEIRPLGLPWEEASVTWNTQPSPGALHGAWSSELPRGTLGIDVSALVTRWATGELPPAGLVLLPADPVMSLTFFSREASKDLSLAPRLVVSCAPATPPVPADTSFRDSRQQIGLDRLRAASTRPVQVRLGQGAVRFAEFRVPVPPEMGADRLARALWFAGEFRDLLRLDDPAAELQLARRSADGRHLFFRQRHAGFPVYPAELGVHLDDEAVTGLSGGYVPDITLAPTPRIPVERAVDLALAAAGEGALPAGDAQILYLNLGLLGLEDASTHLAWRVPVAGGGAPGKGAPGDPAGESTGQGSGSYFIDAASGALLLRLPAAQDAFDLTLNTVQGDIGHGDNLFCWYFAILDVEWFDESGPIPNVNPAPDAEGFAAFNSIHVIDGFWRRSFGRDAHNGSGGQEGLYLDVALTPAQGGTPNAVYWYGCNVLEFTNNMSARDIMGHEYTHGVIHAESDLAYVTQSGALNESFADLFGYLVDSANWTMGESTPLGAARTLNNPPANGHPDHMVASLSGDLRGFRSLPTGVAPACGLPPAGNDCGFVHTNSGIPNKAGALIIAGGLHNGRLIRGVGRSKAARLFYNLITNRLGRSAQFIDARDAAVAEADSSALFTFQEVCDVKNAYASVGLGVGDLDCDGIDDGAEPDSDNDGVDDGSDNCPLAFNSTQADQDKDGSGDACDTDIDGDAFPNVRDNCPLVFNINQADNDGDGIGDACDDKDGDGVPDAVDNCRSDFNPDQKNTDNDSLGDICELDDDNDFVFDGADNCPLVPNTNQNDADGDGLGDACDLCDQMRGTDNSDPDGDGLANPCDPDDDNDGVLDEKDNCPSVANPEQADWDGDGIGYACDPCEQRMVYEDSDFWGLPKELRVPQNFPVPVPVPVCPRCEGASLPANEQVTIDVGFSLPFRARVVDGEGFTRAFSREIGFPLAATTASSGSGAAGLFYQTVRFRPQPFGGSRYKFPGCVVGAPSGPEGLQGSGAASGPAALGSGAPPPADFVAPDQTRYTLEIFPLEPVGPDQAATLQVSFRECADADGDGYGTSADPECPGGGFVDCNDAIPAAFPGNPEACDGLDNDCDGQADGFTTFCGAGACLAAGFCSAGVNACTPGSPSQEVCDGVDNDCDGSMDNVPPPTGTPMLRLSGSDLSWQAVPDATGYDVVRGDLVALRFTAGDFTSALSYCVAHDLTATSLEDAAPPGTVGDVWYLARATNCGGAGSYDSGAPTQVGSRDPEIEASPLRCADCPHDKCVAGGSLEPGCDPCVARICDVNPPCCISSWDPACVEMVRTVCGSLICPESRGSCTHILCSVGAPLSPGCDSPVPELSCVTAACESDPFCCSDQWDDTCVREATQACGYSCT